MKHVFRRGVGLVPKPKHAAQNEENTRKGLLLGSLPVEPAVGLATAREWTAP